MLEATGGRGLAIVRPRGMREGDSRKYELQRKKAKTLQKGKERIDQIGRRLNESRLSAKIDLCSLAAPSQGEPTR